MVIMTPTDNPVVASPVPFYTRHGHEVIPSKGAVIKPRRGVFALVTTGSAILMVWPKVTNDVPELPGGGINDGESVTEAMEREWREEVGIDMSMLHGPVKEYRHVRGFFADDLDEFWVYDQTFQLFDFVMSVTLHDKWTNSEGDLAGWESIAKLHESRMNRAHWLAVKELIPDLPKAANEDFGG